MVNSSLFETNELKATMVEENLGQPHCEVNVSDSDVLSENELFHAVPLVENVEPVPQSSNTCDSPCNESVNIFFKKRRPVFKPPKIYITESKVGNDVKNYLAATPAKSQKVLLLRDSKLL